MALAPPLDRAVTSTITSSSHAFSDLPRKTTLLTRHSVSLTLGMGVKIDADLLSRETAVMLYRTSAVKHLLGGVNTSSTNHHANT